MGTAYTHSFCYTYQVLGDPSVNIRLLSIESATPSKIECSFRHVKNLEFETFNCLSYTWGDPFGNDTESLELPIICNGRHIAVHKNLYEALLSLYAVQREKVAAIWIDAICINQDDQKEKNSQLRIMHEIYAAAESVVIWLGPEGEDKSSISKFRDVAQRLRGQNVSWWDRIWSITDGELADLLGDSVNAETWRAIEDITVRRSYWTRLWIWQEIMAAKEDPIVVCGDHILSWRDVRDVSHAWVHLGITTMNRQNLPTRYHPPPGMIETNHPYKLAFWRDSYREPQNGPSWIRWRFATLVLEQNRNCYLCSDERDKIYAHIGICGYDKLREWDYRKSFWELYIHFWADVMDRLKNVNYLTFIEDAAARRDRPKMSYDVRRKYVPPLPSWVPDLRTSLSPGSMWNAYLDHKAFNISEGLAGQWEEAEGWTATRLDVDRKLGRLTLWGYLFDTVQQFGESQEQLEYQCSIPRTLELIITMLEESSTPYGSLEGIFDAIWSAMPIMGPLTHEIFPVPPDQKRCAQDWLLHTITTRPGAFYIHNDFTQEQDHLRERLHKVLGRFKDIDTDEFFPSQAGCKEYANARRSFVPGGDIALVRRKLFRSRDNWIGKGPQSMQVGDEIWIVPGATTAFILRRKGAGEHVYVGHAYVHGIMQGEACDQFQRLKPEEIVLV